MPIICCTLLPCMHSSVYTIDASLVRQLQLESITSITISPAPPHLKIKHSVWMKDEDSKVPSQRQRLSGGNYSMFHWRVQLSLALRCFEVFRNMNFSRNFGGGNCENLRGNWPEPSVERFWTLYRATNGLISSTLRPTAGALFAERIGVHFKSFEACRLADIVNRL